MTAEGKNTSERSALSWFRKFGRSGSPRAHAGAATGAAQRFSEVFGCRYVGAIARLTAPPSALLLPLLSLLCGAPVGASQPANGRPIPDQSGLAEYSEKLDFTGRITLHLRKPTITRRP